MRKKRRRKKNETVALLATDKLSYTATAASRNAAASTMLQRGEEIISASQTHAPSASSPSKSRTTTGRRRIWFGQHEKRRPSQPLVHKSYADLFVHGRAQQPCEHRQWRLPAHSTVQSSYPLNLAQQPARTSMPKAPLRPRVTTAVTTDTKPPEAPDVTKAMSGLTLHPSGKAERHEQETTGQGNVTGKSKLRTTGNALSIGVHHPRRLR